MKTFKTIYITLASLLFICAIPIRNTYTLSSGYSVTIEGTSNVHSWIEKVGTVSGKGTVNTNSDGSFDLETLVIKMDVHSIKSDKGSIMNNNTYKALKAEEHPQIIFSLTTPIKSLQAKASQKKFPPKAT